MYWTTCGLNSPRFSPPEPPQKMLLSENMIHQNLRSPLQGGVSTSSLPSFIVDLYWHLEFRKHGLRLSKRNGSMGLKIQKSMSVTTNSCRLILSKLVEVVTVAYVSDEDSVGKGLLQILKLRFGQKA